MGSYNSFGSKTYIFKNNEEYTIAPLKPKALKESSYFLN